MLEQMLTLKEPGSSIETYMKGLIHITTGSSTETAFTLVIPFRLISKSQTTEDCNVLQEVNHKLTHKHRVSKVTFN